MKLILFKKEVRAIMTCISVAEGSLSNNFVLATQKQRKRLDKINLDDLYIKLSKILFKV